MTPQQEKKLKRMLKLAEEGGGAKDMEIMDAIVELEEKVDSAVERFEEKAEQVDAVLTEKKDSDIEFATKLAKNMVKEMVDIQKGDKGDTYTLTAEDKQEIANSITVPVVEKIIERTETIREIPIVNETRVTETKEVAVLDVDSLPQYGEKFRDGLELLKEDDRLDKEAVRGITVSNTPPVNPKYGDLWIASR